MIKRSNSYGTYFPSIFDEFFNDFTSFTPRQTVPSVNVLAHESAYELEVAAPGMKKEHFNLEIDNDRLVISADFKQEGEKQDGKYTRKEFSFQSFKRAFTLPEGEIETENISAKYEDGVLRISLPKRSADDVKTSKRIEIA